ncbi:protein YgfX [Shewanella gaetbuli]
MRLPKGQFAHFSYSTQIHYYSLSASFHQLLACWVIFLVVLSSFIAWPELSSPLILISFYILILLLSFCWAWLLYRLKRWHCEFIIDNKGQGKLLPDGDFVQVKPAYICPFVCILYLQLDNQVRRDIWVWADMVNDTDYRTLCRVVNSYDPLNND